MKTMLDRIQASRHYPAALSIVSAVFLALTAMPARAAGPIAEFPTPTHHAFPWGITSGPDGNVWFCEYGVNKIGRVTPAGEITEFSVSVPPIGIASGPDGNLWYAAADLDFGFQGSAIGRMSPTGVTTEFPGAGTACGIVAGPDGNLWFTDCVSNAIGRITPSGAIAKFDLPAGRYPFGIVAGPDGNLWFTEGAGPSVGRISTSGTITEFSLSSGSSPLAISAGPDGNLWVAEVNGVARITTTGEVTEYPLAARDLTLGPDGKLWFVASDGDHAGRLSIGSGTVAADVVFPLPARAFLAGISAGPDGNLWFTDQNASAVGRIDLSAVCAPDSLCLGGRFEITATWAGAGMSGTGKPLPLTTNAGAFSFFDPANLEVFVKVLNACLTSGTFTVYVNGLTHLGVTVTVTDKQTGASRAFVHLDGTGFSLLFDDLTFACP